MKLTYNFRELPAKILGRHAFTDSGALIVSWSAGGFEFGFEAERIRIQLVPDYSADQPCYLGVFLDGKRVMKFAVTTGAEMIMLEDIGSGEHNLRVVRLSEGDCPLKFESVTLSGDDVKLLPPPEYDLRFEFLGDSITCGYGDIADPSVNCFCTCDEDTTRTYAYLTAEHFGAEIRVEAISGQGIVRNCNGDVDRPIPVFFERGLRNGSEKHDFSSWTPDFVVVNAGTNDAGGRVTDEEFYLGAYLFLSRIRAVYPAAKIVWVYGMMNRKYEKVLGGLISSMNDPKLFFLPLETIYAGENEVGAVGHPNERGQRRAADALIKLIEG